MQLGTVIAADGSSTAVLVDEARGCVPASAALGEHHSDALSVVRGFTPAEIRKRLAALPDALFAAAGEFQAPYLHPRLIWGIGLNYQEHARDLSESAPSEEPASFVKGDHTVIGPDVAIPLPWQSERVTAEAELGLIIGRECRDVTEAAALDYVWGVVPILDQTAEDILAKNPRFLTRSKNFPGFFSFGPTITPMDEVLDRFGAIGKVRVETIINGALHRANTVDNMMFSPAHLVSFHSHVMPLYPGDIISTGTPGAVKISDGDVVECRIDGIGTLVNPVGGQRSRPESAS